MKNKSKKIKKISFFSQKKPTKVSFFSPKFPSYLTSHSKPQNLRRYIAGKKRLNRMDKKSFNAWGKPTSMSKKNMTWPQAKVRFPMLNPYKDSDRDGVINLLDCKPFNRKKQGWAHQGTMLYYPDSTTRVKMMSPNKFLRTTFHQSRGAFGSSQEDYEKRILNKENVNRLKKVLKDPKEGMEIPYLNYDEQGRPIGHEGRHRAMAAKQLGIELIPVSVVRKKKEKAGSEIKTMKQLDEYNKRKAKQMEIEDIEEAEHYSKQGSESADISIQQQREYSKVNAEGLKEMNREKELYEKAEEGTLTPEDIEEHELENFKKDYDLKDEDDQTLDYEEEQER